MSPTPSCPMCRAPLAPGQRYCLACGARAAAPRLDFAAESERAHAEARAATAPTPPATAAAGPAPSRLDKAGGPMGLAAVVLVALGVGFLAGQASKDEPPAQRAPIVNIEGVPTGDENGAVADQEAGE